MNREEILRMEAGPGLDRLVAERVVGWHLPASEELPWAWLRTEGDLDVWTGWWHEDPRPWIVESPFWKLLGDKQWSPSTDIAAAWEVVERLYSTGFGVEIYGERGFDWEVKVYLFPRDDEVSAKAQTAPLAICRAALLARCTAFEPEEVVRDA